MMPLFNLIRSLQPSLSKNDTTLLIAASSIVLLILLVTVVMLFTYFQKKKLKFILEKQEAEKKYLEELSNSQLETQEQTLKNIGWELHDNIGQLLSVANMQLNVLSSKIDDVHKDAFKETKAVINTSLKEVRALSKSLNTDVIQNMGLERAIENEINRFNKLKFLDAKLNITGINDNHIDHKDATILFRIIQEFMSNSIKHSKAKNLSVDISYLPVKADIRVCDDGIGFDDTKITKGSGLINMENRAKLINTEFLLKSQKNEGVCLTLSYPKKIS